MRKRISKRRWKARALLGRPIPVAMIIEHRLEGPWEPMGFNQDTCTAVRQRRRGVDIFVHYTRRWYEPAPLTTDAAFRENVNRIMEALRRDARG